MKTTQNDIAAIATKLVESNAKIQDQLDENKRALEELTRKLKLARGTQDIPRIDVPEPPVAPKVARVRDPSLAEKIEAVLRSNTATPAALASSLGVPGHKISAALRQLGDKVVDVGAIGSPMLSWVIGDEAPASELFPLVQRLLRVRPMTFAEIIRFTGAREKRCSGAIVHIQRDEKLSKRLQKSQDRPALWYLRGR